jgi:DNA-directed RNA polymerase II subunit RPB1
MKELVDASKTPKTRCTTLRFRAPYAGSAAFAAYVARTLPLTRLGDLVARCEIVHDPDPAATTVTADAWIVATEALLDGGGSDDASRHVVRLELHQETMRTRQLTPPMVRAMLRERLGGRAHVASSEANAVDWVVRVRFAHAAAMATAGGFGAEHEAILCHRAANVLLDTVVVCGHPDVANAEAATSTRLDPLLHDAPPCEEHVVHAYGALLLDAAASSCVEWERCTSNDVWEVYHTLGVEACAHVLFDELKAVLSFDGSYQDERHLAIIVDTITRSGSLMPLNRHGINRTEASPLMRASFEETMDVLSEAAMHAQSENARGVSTSIMLGQLAEFGTGATRVLFHERCLPPSVDALADSLAPRQRVLRSTCRSHTATELEQVVEYVHDDVRVGAAAASRHHLAPAAEEEEEPLLKRVRFRPASPTGEGA